MLLKCVSDHAESLADGRVVAPGETIKLTKDQFADPFNQERFEDGVFIEVDTSKQEEVVVPPDTTENGGKS